MVRAVFALLLLTTPALATDPPAAPSADEAVARFAEPVLLRSGEHGVGYDRLYPSPVLVDFNRDGRPELFVGDLFGTLTVSVSIGGDSDLTWTEGAFFLGANGTRLDFNNW